MKWNKQGIQLADVPGSGASRIDPNARSGNPRHDTHSGKFGAGGRPVPKNRTPAPANVDPLDYKKMLDAARDAARQFGVFDEADIKAFVQERAASPDQVDIQNFLNLVMEHRKADVLDLLAQELGGAGPVKVVSGPSIRELMGSLGAADVAEVVTRLESMGHSRQKIENAMGNIEKVEQKAQAKKNAA